MTLRHKGLSLSLSLSLLATAFGACKTSVSGGVATTKDDLGATDDGYVSQCDRAPPPELALALLDTSAPAAPAATPSPVEATTRKLLKDRCGACHDHGHTFHPVSDYQTLISQGLVDKDTPASSKIYTYVRDHFMPDGGPYLAADDVATILQWITDNDNALKAAAAVPPAAPAPAPAPAPTGTATPPSLLTEADKLGCIARDLSMINAKRPDYDRTSVRYFTLTNLYNAGASDSDLTLARGALTKLLNSLSFSPQLVKLTAIDPLRTIFRIQLQDYGWDKSTWERLLNASPYGISYLQGTDVVDRIRDATGTGVAHLRADWFIRNASEAPLYYQVLGIPASESLLDTKLGLSPEQQILDGRALRAGLNEGDSGIAKHNRVIERLEIGTGSLWRSFDFKGSSSARNVAQNPLGPCLNGFVTPPFLRCSGITDATAQSAHVFRQDGGEQFFALPNGLLGFAIFDASGARLDKASLDLVEDIHNSDDTTVRGGISCMGCHVHGPNASLDKIGPLAVAPTYLLGSQARLSAARLFRADDPNELAQVTGADQKRFQAALAALELSLEDPDPITGVAHLYRSVDVSLAAAAAEVGMTAATFSTRLGQAFVQGSSLGADVVTQLQAVAPLATGQTVTRAAFEAAFPTLVRAMALGTPARGSIPPPLNPPPAPIPTATATVTATSTETDPFNPFNQPAP